MSRPLRVVLDTNLVISALVFAKGRLTPLRDGWRQARLLPLVSKATAAELIRVLAYPKFRLASQEQNELLADFLPYSEAMAIPAKPPKTPLCRDPFDVPFLELAIIGRSDYLVTGDGAMLALAGKLACPIITAEKLLVLLDLKASR